MEDIICVRPLSGGPHSREDAQVDGEPGDEEAAHQLPLHPTEVAPVDVFAAQAQRFPRVLLGSKDARLC